MAPGKKRRLPTDSDSHHQVEEIVLDNDDDNDETTLLSSVENSSSMTKTKSSKSNVNCADVDLTDDGLDVKIPLSLLMSGTSTGSNECTLLVQVTPENAPALDFHGAGGAIGRFETSEDGVIMDLKGYQYQGRIQPGPTCIVASMHPLIGNNMIKVECITDEFVTLYKGRDQLAQLDAIVEKGDLLDDSFQGKDSSLNDSKGNIQNSNNKNISNNTKQNIRKNKNGNKKRKKPMKR